MYEKDYVDVSLTPQKIWTKKELKSHLKTLEKQMHEAALNLDFERAAKLRDEIRHTSPPIS